MHRFVRATCPVFLFIYAFMDEGHSVVRAAFKHDIPQCSVLRLTFLSPDFVAVRTVKALKCHNLIFFISKYIKSGQKVQCTFDFGTTFILNKSFRLQLHFFFTQF